jgi:hypothetical protein
MRAMWRTDLGRARYLLYAFIIVGAVGLAWLGTQSHAVAAGGAGGDRSGDG